MSKKKLKTKTDKLATRHDFSHLLKTKTAAKVIAAEVEPTSETKSPLDKEIRTDLRMTLIIIGVFLIAIFALWWLVGRNGEIFTLANKIKLF